MSNTATGLGVKAKFNHWTSWAAIAIVAVLAGVLLPQMMPGDMALDKPAPKLETKDKTKLEYSAPALPEAPNPSAMLLRLALGTALVLGLCVLTLWGMRRWVQSPGLDGTLPREMRLKETLPLGNRCCLHLVHLGKQQVLVGVDAGGIKTIVPLPSAFDDVLAEVETDGAKPEIIPFSAKSA